MEDGRASLALVTYRITIVTGELPGSGTNANVKLVRDGALAGWRRRC